MMSPCNDLSFASGSVSSAIDHTCLAQTHCGCHPEDGHHLLILKGCRLAGNMSVPVLTIVARRFNSKVSCGPLFPSLLLTTWISLLYCCSVHSICSLINNHIPALQHLGLARLPLYNLARPVVGADVKKQNTTGAIVGLSQLQAGIDLQHWYQGCICCSLSSARSE